MNSLVFRGYTYFRHALRSVRSKRGFGVHSPFAFEFITEVLNPTSDAGFYCFDAIEQLRYQLYERPNSLTLNNGQTRTLAKIAKTSASTTKDGQILFRCARYTHSQNIIELGTSLGLGSAYLASHSSKAQLYTIDHDTKVQEIAQENLKTLHLKNVRFINENFQEGLKKLLNPSFSLDLAFIDGHHQGEATQHYYQMLLPHTHKDSLLIFHDIHWSEDMYQAWRNILKDEHISTSFECYNMGFVFLNPELNKAHYYA